MKTYTQREKREGASDCLINIASMLRNGCPDINCRIKKDNGVHIEIGTNGGCRCRVRFIEDDLLRVVELLREVLP